MAANAREPIPLQVRVSHSRRDKGLAPDGQNILSDIDKLVSIEKNSAQPRQIASAPQKLLRLLYLRRLWRTSQSQLEGHTNLLGNSRTGRFTNPISEMFCLLGNELTIQCRQSLDRCGRHCPNRA